MEDTISREGWRKSSYSGNGGGNCVEVGDAARVVLVRDTKDRSGAVLTVPADAWARFTSSLKLGPRQQRGASPSGADLAPLQSSIFQYSPLNILNVSG